MKLNFFKLYLSACMVFLCLSSQAQTEKNPYAILPKEVTDAIKKAGKEIKKTGKKLNDVDSTYISPNLYNLAFMLEHSVWYEHYRLGTNREESPQSISFPFDQF